MNLIQRRTFVLALAALGLAANLIGAEPKPRWNLKELGRAPVTYPAPDIPAADLKTIFYEGLPWKGAPTRVFAYYGLPEGASASHKVPAMVLIHGGGGTAFADWVKLWNKRGYAAIAMDTCGAVPVGSYSKWQRHPQGGPPGWGGFAQVDEPMTDQWTYHAVADVILAHSFLRSLPEVDTGRIGVTGISWGGYLTCIVAGVDSRFRCAVPVYGCGFLGENSTWLGDFERLGKERATRWLRWWDPSSYLGQAKMPMFWINGSNDFAYPMDSWQKSHQLARNTRTISLQVRMPHGHNGPGENPEEIRVFVESVLNQGQPLGRVTRQGARKGQAYAVCKSPVPLTKAELNYTGDTGIWKSRKWETIPATLDTKNGRAEAAVPAGATVAYLNFVDDRGCIVSSTHFPVGK
jgi:dienelactone hydrolase